MVLRINFFGLDVGLLFMGRMQSTSRERQIKEEASRMIVFLVKAFPMETVERRFWTTWMGRRKVTQENSRPPGRPSVLETPGWCPANTALFCQFFLSKQWEISGHRPVDACVSRPAGCPRHTRPVSRRFFLYSCAFSLSWMKEIPVMLLLYLGSSQYIKWSTCANASL